MSAASILTLNVDKISVQDRLRPLDAQEVIKIALSIGELGQVSPIEVRPDRANPGSYVLVIGMHRLAAIKSLGHPDIQAVLFDGDLDQARLREIDENLCRHDLNPYDQANFVEERRVVWEKLHGQVKRGGDRRSKGQVVQLAEAMQRSGFFRETAEAFGLNPKTLKRACSRKAHIDKELWAMLKGTDAAKNGALLDKIAKLPLETQHEVWAFAAERGCEMREAVRVVTQLPPKDPRIAQFEALCLAWQRAGEEARADFQKFLKLKAKP